MLAHHEIYGSSWSRSCNYFRCTSGIQHQPQIGARGSQKQYAPQIFIRVSIIQFIVCITATYPQLRQLCLFLRCCLQSRTRCPSPSQFEHLISTRSLSARSSLQLREICPISKQEDLATIRGICSQSEHLPPQFRHFGTLRSYGIPALFRRSRFSSASAGQRSRR